MLTRIDPSYLYALFSKDQILARNFNKSKSIEKNFKSYD